MEGWLQSEKIILIQWQPPFCFPFHQGGHAYYEWEVISAFLTFNRSNSQIYYILMWHPKCYVLDLFFLLNSSES